MRSPAKPFLLAAFLAAVVGPLGGTALAATEQIKPRLNINIPTVHFSDLANTASGQSTGVPWIAEYTVGLLQYLTAIAGFLAALIIVIAGIQWAAAGTGGAVGRAKKRLTAALVGLVIAFGIYGILEAVSPELVKLRPLQLKQVEQFRLDLLNTVGFADQEAFLEDATIQHTNVPNAPPDGTPPPEAAMWPIDEALDLYSPGNKFGHQVRGQTPAQRVHSICASTLGRGGTREEVLERARAITRVWLVELVSRNGGIYVRGQDPRNGMCIPQVAFIFTALRSHGKALCMQEYLGDRVERPQAIIEGCNQVRSGQVNDEDLAAACGSNGEIFSTLRDGYRQCWCLPAFQKGLVGADCSNFAYDLIPCALGVTQLNNGVAAADLAFQNADGVSWTGSGFSLEPFTMFHLGASDAKGANLVHTVTHIGGLGVRFDPSGSGTPGAGQEIAWVEMGGGGAVDAGFGQVIGTGVAGRPKLNNVSSIGVQAHYGSYNYLAGPTYAGEDEYAFAYFYLSRVLGDSPRDRCGGKTCYFPAGLAPEDTPSDEE
jgi:hypothetical protein